MSRVLELKRAVPCEEPDTLLIELQGPACLLDDLVAMGFDKLIAEARERAAIKKPPCDCGKKK